jgi:DNA ligase-1
MTFLTFCNFCNSLSSNQSRIFKKNIITEILKQCSEKETSIICYLLQGTITNIFNHQPFNLSEKIILKIGCTYFKCCEVEFTNYYKTIGDLAKTFYDYNEKYNTNNNQINNEITIEELFNTLTIIANIHGSNSQKNKEEIIVHFFPFLSSLALKYFINIIIGNMGIGVFDKTILESISELIKNEVSYEQIEYCYSMYPDIGFLAEQAKKNNIQFFSDAQPRINIPIIPAAANRIKSVEELEKDQDYIVQPKYDGMRIQVHVDIQNNSIQIFSRNLLNVSDMFKDLQNNFLEICKKKNILKGIFDGEIVVYDTEKKIYTNFQDTIKRKRIHNINDYFTNNFPAHLILFDIMMINDASTIKKQYTQRLTILQQYFDNTNDFIYISPTFIINNFQFSKIKQLYDEYKQLQFEGIMIKKSNSIYHAGKRSNNWIKWKIIETDNLADTLDIVIVGYFYGKGRRTQQGIGALLCAVYDAEKNIFVTITKIGTGMKEEVWKDLKEKCSAYEQKTAPCNVIYPPSLIPDIYVYPHIIISVSADSITISKEHSSSYSLRFPRMIHIVEDKKIENITSVQELQNIKK